MLPAGYDEDFLRNNRVSVRIWMPAAAMENALDPRLFAGHISIELESEQMYISLWPRDQYDECVGRLQNDVTHSATNSDIARFTQYYRA